LFGRLQGDTFSYGDDIFYLGREKCARLLFQLFGANGNWIGEEIDDAAGSRGELLAIQREFLIES
jgi:hypothetical protein